MPNFVVVGEFLKWGLRGSTVEESVDMMSYC